MDQPVPGLHFGYQADPGRAVVLDRRVRANLSRSLAAIAAALGRNRLVAAERILPLAERIAAAPVRPLVFALYTVLVDAIQADDDAAIRATAAQLGDPGLGEAATFRIVNLGGDPPGAAASELYFALLDDDPDAPISIGGVGEADFAPGRAAVTAALALLADAAPEFAGEILALCNEVVLAGSMGEPGDGMAPFSSASSPYLWGGIQLDPTGAGRIALAETLVHEASHCLLNGLADAGELSTNPREARYTSPLRADPRPMEGIIHATYVLGRMTMMLDRIRAWPGLSSAERADVATRRAQNLLLFGHGLATVRAHGVLTPDGAKAMEGCFALAERLAA